MMHSALRKQTCDVTQRRLRIAFERMIEPAPDAQSSARPVARSYADLIRMLSFEINETVLPRRLVLSCEGKAAAELILSNRRLVALSIGDRQIEANLRDGDADPEEVARIYAGALASLCATSGPLEVRRAGRAVQVATSSTACTAERLANLSEAPVMEERCKTFLRDMHSKSLGWIYRTEGEEAVAHDPDAKLFTAMRLLDDALLEQAEEMKGNVGKLDRPGPFCTAFALADGAQVLVATDRKTRLVLAVPEGAVADAMTRWQSVFKGAR